MIPATLLIFILEVYWGYTKKICPLTPGAFVFKTPSSLIFKRGKSLGCSSGGTDNCVHIYKCSDRLLIEFRREPHVWRELVPVKCPASSHHWSNTSETTGCMSSLESMVSCWQLIKTDSLISVQRTTVHFNANIMMLSILTWMLHF